MLIFVLRLLESFNSFVPIVTSDFGIRVFLRESGAKEETTSITPKNTAQTSEINASQTNAKFLEDDAFFSQVEGLVLGDDMMSEALSVLFTLEGILLEEHVVVITRAYFPWMGKSDVDHVHDQEHAGHFENLLDNIDGDFWYGSVVSWKSKTVEAVRQHHWVENAAVIVCIIEPFGDICRSLIAEDMVLLLFILIYERVKISLVGDAV